MGGGNEFPSTCKTPSSPKNTSSGIPICQVWHKLAENLIRAFHGDAIDLSSGVAQDENFEGWQGILNCLDFLVYSRTTQAAYLVNLAIPAPNTVVDT